MFKIEATTDKLKQLTLSVSLVTRRRERGSLSRRLVDCQGRAQNRIGYGRWNVVKRG